MNKAMKMMMTVGAVLCAGVCMARPMGGPGPGRGHGPVIHGGFGHRPPPPMHHHSHSVWGHGGRNFWPGFVGGVVGGLVYDAITPAPVVVSTPTVYASPTVATTPVVAAPVVTTPVYSTQNVWVEGRYVDQVQANGTVIRVWQPGHYEQRQVVVQ